MINSWADARSFVVRLCANFVQLHSATNTQHTHVFAQFGVWFASHHIIIPTAARITRRKNKSQRSGNHQTVDHGIVLCLIMRASGREVCAHFMRAYAYVYVYLCVTRVKRENFNLSFYGPHRKYRHRRRILSKKGRAKSWQTPEAHPSSCNTQIFALKIQLSARLVLSYSNWINVCYDYAQYNFS